MLKANELFYVKFSSELSNIDIYQLEIDGVHYADVGAQYREFPVSTGLAPGTHELDVFAVELGTGARTKANTIRVKAAVSGTPFVAGVGFHETQL